MFPHRVVNQNHQTGQSCLILNSLLPEHIVFLFLLYLYQSKLRNQIKALKELRHISGDTLRSATPEGMTGQYQRRLNCQGYDSVDDWYGARLFLSACQVAGMFNVLIIGCSVVYISLSVLLSHLNCQSTSKSLGSSVFLLTPRMFSLSWVPVICYDFRASWQTGLV